MGVAAKGKGSAGRSGSTAAPAGKVKPSAPDPGGADAAVAVVRNDEPLLLLGIDRATTLAKVRETLLQRRGVLTTDVFTDRNGFAVPPDEEDAWTVARLLGRSGDETLRLRSTERRPVTAEPVEVPTLPELPDQKPTLPSAPAASQQIALPLRGVEVGEDITDPIHLGTAEWSALIARNHLGNGIRLDLATPLPSFLRAFEVVGGIPPFIVYDDSEVGATVTRTEREAAMVRSKFATAAASASYAFMAGSVEASYRQRTATSTAATRTAVTGTWSYPRIIVRLSPKDLAPTKALTDEVASALAAGTIEQRFYALRAVFDRYGQVWATEVTLGGQLVLTDEATLDATQQESEVEAAMRAAVSVKVGLAKGTAKAAAGTAAATREKLVEQFQQKQLTATGGDTRLVEDSAKWTPTVGPVANWRVIGRRGLRPLYEVLDEDLRRQVREVLEAVDARFIPTTFEVDTPQPSAVGEVTRAERDGLVVVVLRSAPGASAVVGASTSPSGIPASAIAYATSSNVTVGGTKQVVQSQTLTIPVRRGDNYLVDRVQGTVPDFPVRMYPTVEIGRPLFAPQVRVDGIGGIESSRIAPTSGLVVLTATVDSGWFGGNVEVFDAPDRPPLASTSVSAPPTEWKQPGRRSPRGSLCVPVVAGATYTIRSTPLPIGAIPAPIRPILSQFGLCESPPTYGAVFVPFDAGVARLERPLECSDDVYRAESDGVLLCCAKSDALTTYEVLSGPDRATFQKSEPLGVCTVGVLAAAGWKDGATITVPIKRGDYYWVRSSTGRPLERMLFFPLRRF